MPNTVSTHAPRPRPRRETSPALLGEEIERIQALLRQLDDLLSAQKEDVSLKELAQAVRTAGEGGRSIAQLRKVARELQAAVLDEETRQLQASLLTLLDRLGQRRKQAAPPDSAPHSPAPGGGPSGGV